MVEVDGAKLEELARGGAQRVGLGYRRRGGVARGKLAKSKGVEQFQLPSIPVYQVRRAADEAVLNELENRGVIHRNVRSAVFARERRENYVGNAEADLGGKNLRANTSFMLALGSLLTRSQWNVGEPVGKHGLYAFAFTAIPEPEVFASPPVSG